MSIYKSLNESDAPQFYDEEAGIQYEFKGFDSPLSYEEKLSLIAKQGSPRSIPKSIKSGPIIIEEVSPEFEVQMIVKSPSSPENSENP